DDDNTVQGKDGRATEIVGLGNVDYVRKLNDQWTFGLHAGNYFGLLLNWGSEWVGRYTGNQAIVIAPQIQPTLSYKINDQWSVGAGLGLTLGYLKDKVSVNVPGETEDGKFRYSDTDFAVQPNLGVMWQPTENTRLGLRYLVETELKFKDDPSYKEVNNIELGSGRELGLDMTMPQSLKLGAWQKVSDRWAVLGNVGWEDWSEFGEVGFEISGLVDSSVEVETEDTWHVGIGAEYQKTDKLMYTMGASWDSSWQRDKNRTALVPIGTVYRIGGGFKYQQSDDFEWGSGFSIFYEGDLPVKDQEVSPVQTFSGEYENVVLYWLTIFGSWR
ncbi:MAG: OmpP1/FadL family transporter, partial [bacterium]